jgi:SAM-dependent methyltransferase
MSALRSGADWDRGWPMVDDMVRFYPSGVHRRRLVCGWLAPYAPRSILDAGCGPGHMLGALRARFPDAALIGVDSAADTVKENRRKLRGARFEVVHLGSERLDERFDAVVCSEVLEHIEDDQAALQNLAAMTGRHLLVTVPTGPVFPLEAGFGHLRHYELNSFTARIESLGLKVIRAQAWGFPFMTAFKRAANLRPGATTQRFGSGSWGWSERMVGRALTSLFYLNLPFAGPQLLVLAERTTAAAG